MSFFLSSTRSLGPMRHSFITMDTILRSQVYGFSSSIIQMKLAYYYDAQGRKEGKRRRKADVQIRPERMHMKKSNRGKLCLPATPLAKRIFLLLLCYHYKNPTQNYGYVKSQKTSDTEE